MKVQVTGHLGCHFDRIRITLIPGAGVCISAVGDDSMKFGRRVGQQILAVANGSRLDAVGREDPGYRARLFRVDDAKIVLSVVFAFYAAMHARAEEGPGLGHALSVVHKFPLRRSPTSVPWQTFID